jgi:acetylornithine deacetylase
MGIERLSSRSLELVGTTSVTGDEADAIDLVTSWLEPVADEIDRWTVPMAEIESDPAYPGREVERDTVPVVAARITGNRPGPTLVLTGHVDTVPIGDFAMWSRDPLGELEGDTLYGRGAADMKAGMVAAVETFTRFAAEGRDFAGEVRLVAVSGEEDGGHGTLAAIRRGWTGDIVIITEPTADGAQLRLVAAHGGALTFSIEVPGRTAHAATRLLGESALDHYWTVNEALQRLETELNAAETDPIMSGLGLPYPTTVGIVHGGEWASNVMGRLTAEVRVGVTIDETIAEAEQRFERTLREAIAGDPWLDANPITVERTGAAFGSSRIDPAHPLVTTLQTAAQEVIGATAPLVGAPYGCDMALWVREAGAATVVFGPGNVAHAHSVDERVDLHQAAEVVEVLVAAAHRLLA